MMMNSKLMMKMMRKLKVMALHQVVVSVNSMKRKREEEELDEHKVRDKD